jgi:hypothetical protein
MAKLKYETEDGKLFDTFEEADKHEKLRVEAEALGDYLSACEGVWLDDCRGDWTDVAFHLLKEYTVTKKEPS